MPDFKCVACGIRLRTHGGATGCPGRARCARPRSTPVEELSELVGFRRWQPVKGCRIEERFGDRVSHLDRTPRGGGSQELRVAAERWLDEGGSFDTEAVAAAPARRLGASGE